MPIWINAGGIAGIGVVYGYVLMYALKRYLPPLVEKAPSLKELVFFLGSFSLGGVIGASLSAIDGINYVGAYGLGLFAGFAANIGLTLRMEDWMRKGGQGTRQLPPVRAHTTEQKEDELKEGKPKQVPAKSNGKN